MVIKMIVKVLIYGDSGSGKTHLSVEIAKAVDAVLIDCDEGAEPIIQKLKADNVMRLHGTPYTTFLSSLSTAVKTDKKMIIIDSLTEFMELAKRYIKEKAVRAGRFYLQGMHEKPIQDPDTFIVTWELTPSVYDKVRDVMRVINSAHKSFIVTYHPPTTRSQGQVNLFKEVVRLCDIVVLVSRDTVRIQKDRFFDRIGEMSSKEFVEYVRSLLVAERLDEVSVWGSE